RGAQEALKLAAHHRDRVLGAVYIGNAVRIGPGHPEMDAARARFTKPTRPDPQGWDRMNRQYWLEHYDDFADFFFDQCFPEAHSTKPHEDCVGWALETTPEVLLADASNWIPPDTALEWARAVTSPTL